MSEVKIPTNAEEAAAMALVGMSWLEQNAPEKLTELHREIRAEAVLDAVNFGRNQTKYFLRSSEDILQQIEQYAEIIRQGEVK